MYNNYIIDINYIAMCLITRRLYLQIVNYK